MIFANSTIPSVDAKTIAEVKTRFVRNVYNWMAGGLTVTAVVALLTAMSPTLMRAIIMNKVIFYALLFGELGLVLWLSVAINRMSAQTAGLAFLAYSIMNGLTMSSIFIVYTGSSIAVTFGVTAGTFFCCAVYGTVTKRDLTSVGSFAVMALIGLIIASLVNMFLNLEGLDVIISYAGVLIFVALTAYDVQKIQNIGVQAAGEGSDALTRYSIMGALALYLDFINLFLHLLRIMGGRRD